MESSSQGTIPRRSGPMRENTIAFRHVAIVDGDSSYNRRHKQGRFKGESIPFGALVDFMPQPDTRVESMGAKTIPGVFIGYHIYAGGLWSCDYLVADLAPFRKDCDVAKSKVKIHSIKEIVKSHSGTFIFQSPVGDKSGSFWTQILESLLTCPTWSTRATTRLPGRLAVVPTVFASLSQGRFHHP